MPSRKWTTRQRKAQAEVIRRVRPWDHSTGPRNPEGMARSSQNALKHGVRSKVVKDYRQVVRENRRFGLFDFEAQERIETARETVIFYVGSLMGKKDMDALFTGQQFIATQTKRATRDFRKYLYRFMQLAQWDLHSLRSPRIKS